MRVLVTGATGFVGMTFLRLASKELEVVATTRTASRNDGRVECDARVAWAEADLARPGFRRSLPAEIDVVVHLAQSRFDRNFPEGATDVVDVNVRATAELLEYAREARARRFILASTGTIYAPSSRPLTEDSPLDCSSFYAASKRSAELLTRPYGEYFSCIAPRIFTVYGPGQRGRLIAELVERVRTGDPIQIRGRRGLILTPIYVDDLARILLGAALVEGERGFQILNVGGREAVGVADIAEAIGTAMGSEPRFEFTGEGEAGGFVADLASLDRALPFTDPTPFETGIRRTVAGVVHGR